MLFIDQVDIRGKKLLIRVDFNVPQKNGVISDDHRIRAALPTIRYALEQGAAIILCAHLGKPKGKVVPELSLCSVARRTAELIGQDVPLAPPSTLGQEALDMAKELMPGHIMMLENLRFNSEEIAKSFEERKEFGQKLAEMADIYVNDAFGVAHRENASVVDVPRFITQACGGFLLKREVEFLDNILSKPNRPYVCVSGGAKVSSKLGILNNLLGKVDDIIIGGAMANTFLLAQGKQVGNSLVEKELVEAACDIMQKAKEKGSNLHLPVDFVYAASPDAQEQQGVCDADSIPDDMMVLDIGPKSAKLFCDIIQKAQTVVWNGPMGLFEIEAFANGSYAVCRAVAALQDAVTIVGGGDTDAVVHQLNLVDSMSFISTGGGSFLKFLEGEDLPAFKALKENLNS